MRSLARYTGLALVLLAASGAGALAWLQSQGVTPRALAPYVKKRSSGHNPAISGAGSRLAATLLALDRGDNMPATLPALKLGAQPQAAGAGGGTARPVFSAAEAERAFALAAAGDTIVFAPGVYRISRPLGARRPGSADAPVTVRAQQPGSVTIEVASAEGFVVAAPYWRFENLSIRGACGDDSHCEHAFHVVGAGAHFTALNNTILDFNAHFKINGENGSFPDHGLIEGNTLSNTRPRRTANPVTPIDLVAASDWIVRRNLITDFIKAGGDRISYGAFAKGAGARNRFESNAVVCEQRLRGLPGQRIGLSFGGGGTGKPYCRDHKCVTEQEQGVMQANLVASCSDAGIYVNAGAATRLIDNTLADTAGIDVRFPESSAEADGNLVDGQIRARNGGRLRGGDNLETPIAYSYLGYHPLRKLFTAPGDFDFSWREAPPQRRAGADEAQADLCGAARGTARRYGAIEDFAACLAPRR
jgi:hypothetical protein